MFCIWGSVGSILGVPKKGNLSNFWARILVNFTEQDFGTSFHLAHTTGHLWKIILPCKSQNCENWSLSVRSMEVVQLYLTISEHFFDVWNEVKSSWVTKEMKNFRSCSHVFLNKFILFDYSNFFDTRSIVPFCVIYCIRLLNMKLQNGVF